jgi:hypothetical protein
MEYRFAYETTLVSLKLMADTVKELNVQELFASQSGEEQRRRAAIKGKPEHNQQDKFPTTCPPKVRVQVRIFNVA